MQRMLSMRVLWAFVLVFGLIGGGTYAAAQTTTAPQNNAASGALASAVVLMYHRFGDDAFPSTSVDMDQFMAHIAELKSGKYNVIPLPDLVAALQSGTPLPDRTVAISVDDAFRTLYDNAWPIFQREGLPFTLFVATEALDRGLPDYMTWDQIRELHDHGVTIGSQAVTHPHMPTHNTARNRLELTDSADRLAKEVGTRPTLFAYPYGEASSEIMSLARETGYIAAFGQHSGVANATSPMFYLPRFPINVNYGGVDRFKRLINTLPLTVEALSPSNPTLGGEGTSNPPNFGFTVSGDLTDLSELACYHSDASQISQFDRLGNRIEVRFDGPFASGRTRINCTLPTSDGRWRWFGMQYYVPPAP